MLVTAFHRDYNLRKGRPTGSDLRKTSSVSFHSDGPISIMPGHYPISDWTDRVAPVHDRLLGESRPLSVPG